MNTIPKVLLIVILPILLVGTIWFRYSDSEAKLPALDESVASSFNRYLPNADTLFNTMSVKGLSSDNLLDTLSRYINRIEIFSGEEKIDKEEATAQYQQFIDAFSSIFVDRTESFLSSPQESWPATKLKEFQKGINEIQRLTNSYGVSSSYSTQCNEILATLTLYNKGLGAVNDPYYRGLSNLQNKRAIIRECEANEYIQNNSSFSAQIAVLPSKLRASHSDYVKRQCERLADQMESPYTESSYSYNRIEKSSTIVNSNLALKKKIDKILSDYNTAWGAQHNEHDYYQNIHNDWCMS